jgi:hypothetical protein
VPQCAATRFTPDVGGAIAQHYICGSPPVRVILGCRFLYATHAWQAHLVFTFLGVPGCAWVCCFLVGCCMQLVRCSMCCQSCAAHLGAARVALSGLFVCSLGLLHCRVRHPVCRRCHNVNDDQQHGQQAKRWTLQLAAPAECYSKTWWGLHDTRSAYTAMHAVFSICLHASCAACLL